ncbi:response regulator transcription factor [Cohnella mopanensis]|uniref:response regulator transcription factor n=1 Tax=Cohnella mopanensis TaxID=2911966 RepID=UPI001EF94AB7|nr:response regulator [Cohnella mopanensis]
MKVLIVDDEKHVRNAINMLADWDRHGITEILQASDGEDAVSLIREKAPQIVLTDMRMPRKDGAELLTWLHAHNPEIKVIVISGYDDFELVRHAVRNGGMDYILKPVKADALNEALGKATEYWRKEEINRQRFTQKSIEVNEMKPHYADKLLTDLVTGQGRREILNQLREEFKLPSSLSSCSVAVIAVSQLDHKLLAKFNNQIALIFFTLCNICNELLKSKGISFRHLNSSGEIVILYWDERGSFNAMLEEINQGIYLTLRRHVHFGMATKRTFPDDMPRAYHEASKALWRRNLLEPNRMHSFSEEGIPSSRPLRLTAIEEQLRLTALSGNRERIEAVTKMWLEDLQQSGSVTPEQLIQWDKEWDWMHTQWIEGDNDKGVKVEESDEFYTELSIRLPLNEEGLLAWEDLRMEMEHRLAAVSKLLTQQHSKDQYFIHDIAKYMESHYQDEISLQDIAARFFLSREYIARKFKQEYGVTLLDYLSRIRIDKAKLLLHNPHLRIAQVSEMVGYHDEKYFSRVFKKLEGINPGEYRKEQTLD